MKDFTHYFSQQLRLCALSHIWTVLKSSDAFVLHCYLGLHLHVIMIKLGLSFNEALDNGHWSITARLTQSNNLQNYYILREEKTDPNLKRTIFNWFWVNNVALGLSMNKHLNTASKNKQSSPFQYKPIPTTPLPEKDIQTLVPSFTKKSYFFRAADLASRSKETGKKPGSSKPRKTILLIHSKHDAWKKNQAAAGKNFAQVLFTCGFAGQPPKFTCGPWGKLSTHLSDIILSCSQILKGAIIVDFYSKMKPSIHGSVIFKL